MSIDLIEKTASEIGFAGFFQAAVQAAEQGDSSVVVCTATSFLMSLKPKNYEISINEDDDEECYIYFVSDTTKESYEIRLPLNESIRDKGKAIEKLFSLLSLEFAFKSAKVTHAKRIQ